MFFYTPSHCLRLYSFKTYLFDHGIFDHAPSRPNASQLGTVSCITIGNRLVPVVSPSLILLIPVQIYTVFGLNLILDLNPSLEEHKLTFAFKRTYFCSAVSLRTSFCSISDGRFADQHTKSMNCSVFAAVNSSLSFCVHKISTSHSYLTWASHIVRHVVVQWEILPAQKQGKLNGRERKKWC